MVKAPLVAGLAVALLIGAFMAGRSTAPVRIEERERVVTKTVEVAAKEKVETSAHDQSSAQRDETRYRWREVIKPSGEVVRTATHQTTRESQATRRTEDTKRETEVVYVDRFVDREVTKVVEGEKATWGIAARGGLRVGPGGYVFGAEASKRLAGPLWGAIYATTAKEVGIAVRWEF